MPPHLPRAVCPPSTDIERSSFTCTYWLVLLVAVTLTAAWVAWPALAGVAPLEIPRLLIACALAGAASFLVLTVLEMRLAPWRFMP